MISNALIELNIDEDQTTLISSGERVEIQYTITNQATRQDSFDLSVDYTPAIGWIIEEEQRPPIVINPGASTIFHCCNCSNQRTSQRCCSNHQANSYIDKKWNAVRHSEYSNVMIETVYDVGFDCTFDRISPGSQVVRRSLNWKCQTTAMRPSSASIHLMDAPTSWSYSVRLDGVILETAHIDLGVTTGNSVEQVELLLYVPMSEAAGEFHSVTIAVQPEGQDINPNDNQATIDMITGSITPEFNGSDYHAMVDSTLSLNGTITNVGNALESSMDVGLNYRHHPQQGCHRILDSRHRTSNLRIG